MLVPEEDEEELDEEDPLDEPPEEELDEEDPLEEPPEEELEGQIKLELHMVLSVPLLAQH